MFQNQPPTYLTLNGNEVDDARNPPLFADASLLRVNTPSIELLENVNTEYDRPLEAVVTRDDLNNFPMRVARHIKALDFSGDAEIRLPNETNRELITRCCAEMQEIPQARDFEGFSKRYLTSSATQVATDIEAAIAQCGVSKASFIYVEALRLTRTHDTEFVSLCCSICIPLYRRLREMGYSHRDLTE